MKNLCISIILLIFFQSQSIAQTQHFSMQQFSSGLIDTSAGYKPICVSNMAIASILPQKYVSLFPEQKGGTMKISQIDIFNMTYWELNFNGTMFPFGMIYKNDHYYVVGAFTDSINVNGSSYYGIDTTRLNSFIACINFNGQLKWIRTITDSILNNMARS